MVHNGYKGIRTFYSFALCLHAGKCLQRIGGLSPTSCVRTFLGISPAVLGRRNGQAARRPLISCVANLGIRQELSNADGVI